MADNDRRTEGNQGGAPQQGSVQSLRNAAEAAQQSASAGLDAARRAADGTTEQVNLMAQQLAEAAEVYRGVAQRIAEEARTLAGRPMAAVGGLQEVSRAWAEWLQGAVQANARFSQEVMRARSLPEIAQVHARFVEESLAGLREGGTRMLEAAGELVERTIDAGAQPGGETEQEEEGDEGPVPVAEVMTRNVRLASPEDTVQEVAQVMAQADAGVLPVGENDRIIGMLTDRDIAVRVVGAAKDPTRTKVREAMTPGVEYCFEDEDLGSVAEKMAEQRLRRLPVLTGRSAWSASCRWATSPPSSPTRASRDARSAASRRRAGRTASARSGRSRHRRRPRRRGSRRSVGEDADRAQGP